MSFSDGACFFAGIAENLYDTVPIVDMAPHHLAIIGHMAM
jgi:hypothetical protein